MNEIIQWLVLIALVFIVVEIWIAHHSFLCYYEEEFEEIRNRVENLQRQGRARK